MRAFVVILLLCAASAPFALLAEEPKADPQAKLETAIAEMIRLAEAKEFLKLIKTFAAPDDLKRIEMREKLEDLAKNFEKDEARSKDFLKMLKTIAARKPLMEDDGKKAIYRGDDGDSFPAIKFVKIEGKWYVLDK